MLDGCSSGPESTQENKQRVKAEDEKKTFNPNEAEKQTPKAERSVHYHLSHSRREREREEKMSTGSQKEKEEKCGDHD
jgi:hypothetical protein